MNNCINEGVFISIPLENIEVFLPQDMIEYIESKPYFIVYAVIINGEKQAFKTLYFETEDRLIDVLKDIDIDSILGIYHDYTALGYYIIDGKLKELI